MNAKVEYLPQLEDSIPPEAAGYTLSMYSVALEGWRRGLTLTFLNNRQSRSLVKFKLSDGNKEHVFQVARGDKVPSEAIRICIDKNLTKEYLKKANVPVADGDHFEEDASDEEMVNFANELGYPLVLKPSDGTGGHGVIANIKNENEFKEALNYVKNELGYKKLMVEKYFAGEDYRLHVIDGKVIGAFKKDRANVIGDGKHTIKQLIALKNEQRTKTPALRNRPIKVDKETENLLRANGQTLESIPAEGERVYLKSKNNVTSGGDPIDITDELTDEIKEIAINASKAIPGLVQCGVDMMVDKDKNSGIVLEVNSRPHITAHLYPMEGKARDIPKAVIDYYFPETEQNNSKPSYYFDFKPIWDAFLNGVCEEYTVPDIPKGKLAATRFRITGVWGSELYKTWVRKHARKLKLHGYVKHLSNGETSVVVSGRESSVNKFREIITNEAPGKKKVEKVEEKSWVKPVKIGFELRENSKRKATPAKKVKPVPLASPADPNKDGYFPVHLEYPSKKKRKTKTKTTGSSKTKSSTAKTSTSLSLKQERDYYKKKYENMLKSKSWKVTAPVRLLGKMIKK